MNSRSLTRREFVASGVAAAGILVTACLDPATGPAFNLTDAELLARPMVPSGTVSAGSTPIGIGNPHDGFMYVPASYQPSIPAPLLILIHGDGQTSASWKTGAMLALADEFGVVLLAPDARSTNWDYIVDRQFGVDVDFIDLALGKLFSKVNIDATRIGMAGFSDGASYTLSLGIINSDFIKSVIAFSPAAMYVPIRKGSPRIFIAHGIEDTISPIGRSRDGIVPVLFSVGLEPHYVEFTGGHEIPTDIQREAMEWFTDG